MPSLRELDDLLHALDCLFEIGPRGAVGHAQLVDVWALVEAAPVEGVDVEEDAWHADHLVSHAIFEEHDAVVQRRRQQPSIFLPVAPRVQEYFSCARTRECSALQIFGAASSDRQTRAGKNNLSWRPFGFFALRRLSAFRTPGNNLGVETKRCVNDGAFSLAREYGTTEKVLTSSDDATKKPRIVCSASAKLLP